MLKGNTCKLWKKTLPTLEPKLAPVIIKREVHEIVVDYRPCKICLNSSCEKKDIKGHSCFNKKVLRSG